MNRSTKRNVLVFFAVISIACFFLSSCKKPEDRSCFKRSGDPDTLQLNLGEFDKLHLKEHITYYLVQDSVNKVVLHGGKNLLKQVHAAVNTEHGELTLSNENKCRFFRYRTNEIEAYIHFVDLKRILFEGTDSLSSIGLLNLDQLEITTNRGAGSVRLNVHANILNAINLVGWSDIRLDGQCSYLRTEILGNGSISTTGLEVSDSLTVVSGSDIVSKINAEACKLKVELSGTGDLWYYGFPVEIYKKEYYSGRLIDKN